jgi:hypothetical protein
MTECRGTAQYPKVRCCVDRSLSSSKRCSVRADQCSRGVRSEQQGTSNGRYFDEIRSDHQQRVHLAIMKCG